MTIREFRKLLDQARQGDINSRGRLVEKYRPYLLHLARDQLVAAVSPRIDASDVVQLSCLELHRDFEQFRGCEEGEFVAWVRQIVRNNAANVIRNNVVTQKRSTDRDKSLDETGCGGLAIKHMVQAGSSTPSQKFVRKENEQELKAALQHLPDDQREAVRLKHLEGRSLKQLAEHFQRSEVAVAGLLKRGIANLREQLDQSRNE